MSDFQITTNLNHPQIEAAVQYLAGLDTDHATVQNGVGFNGRDTEFGCSVAAASKVKRLSDKQLQKILPVLWRYNNNQLRPAGYTLPTTGELDLWLRQRERLYPYTPPIVQLPTSTTTSMGAVVVLHGELSVTMPPYPHYLQWVKAIKTLQVQGRIIARYHKDENNRWSLPQDWAQELIKVLPETHFVYDPAILQSLADTEKAQQIAAAEREIQQAKRQIEVRKLLRAAKLDQPLLNGWHLHDYQREAVEFVFKHERVLIGDDLGLGKAQPLHTKVLTPVGFKQMGDLRVGDFVIGSDGKATKVTGVYPQGVKPVYKVNINDGTSVECCEDHLWAVQSATHKSRGVGFRVKSLKEMMSAGLTGTNGNIKNYLPMVEPVEFIEQDLPLHPYVVGVLLGDGCLSQQSVTWDKPDAWLATKVESLLPSTVKVNKLSDKHYSITRHGKSGDNPVLDDLRNLGMIGCTALTKFIPDVYKYSSVESRIHLLQGLLDTDGSTCNNTIEYSSSSEQLLDDVQFLVESLGGVAYKSSRIPNYTYKGEKLEGARSYRVTISLPANLLPFSSPIKADKYTPRTKYQPSRGIKSVDFVGDIECQCISVAAKDHLYVTEHCIVTHNTIESLKAAAAYQQVYGADIICIVPISTMSNWEREASVVGCTIKVVGQTAGRIPDPATITKPFVLIADEAHCFKNLQSQRTKKWLALCESPHLVCNIAMSATPVKNGSPSDVFALLKGLKHDLGKSKVAFETRYGSVHQGYLRELHQILTVEKPVMIRRRAKDVLQLPPFSRQMVEGELSSMAQEVYNTAFSRMQREYKERIADGDISSMGWELVILNHLRHAGSIAKIETTLQMVLDLVQGVDGEAGEQVVVFTTFKDTAYKLQDLITANGYTVGLLTGDTAQAARQPMFDKFQSKQLDVMVCMAQAGGVGINLFSASKVILHDRDWNINSQLEGRIYRQGQQNPVTSSWIQHTKIDHWIDGKLLTKAETSDLIVEGYSVGLEGVSWNEEARNLLANIFSGEYNLPTVDIEADEIDDDNCLPQYGEEF